MRLGLLAILVGVVFLLKNLNLIAPFEWSILWPIFVIYIGIAIVTRDRCWHCKVWHNNMRLVCADDECEECGK